MADIIIPVWFVNLTVKRIYAITLFDKQLSEFAFAHLRYFLGGDRPSQTTVHKLSLKKLVKLNNKDGISLLLTLPSILHK